MGSGGMGFLRMAARVAAPDGVPKKTAVIIMGNPAYVDGDPRAGAFYRQIRDELESAGYEVTMDPGEPYTSPEPADLWVGHSRGVDRLRFAPDGTETVGFGAPTGAINHPDDDPVAGKEPSDAHYELSPEMLQALRDVMA